MLPEHDFSLQSLNTFGMGVYAAFYSAISKEADIPQIYEQPAFRNGIFILGGGSNILFTKNVAQWVLHNRITGIEPIKEDDSWVWLRAGGGVIWHDFVRYCVSRNYGGVENLSLIPGTVGAAPMQNIGAYGAEVKDTIEEVRAWHIPARQYQIFTNTDCRFGYRDSIFKQRYRQQLIITSVVFRLAKKPVFNIAYGNIREELERMNVRNLSVKHVSDAVMRIRTAKLPDPKVTGNAGSFFKNPEVSAVHFAHMKQQYALIPGYPVAEGLIKVPAGWLIEQCGWKGFRNADAGVHPRQALVLVNYGRASGTDIADLSQEIQESVRQKFGIQLDREVQVY